LRKKLISVGLVLVLTVALAGAMPGTVAAQDECPVAVTATSPFGALMAKVFVIAESFLDTFVTKEWNADNRTCNVTGLSSGGVSLVASLHDITMSGMKIVADVMRMLAGA
jgi:hypothetical protein